MRCAGKARTGWDGVAAAAPGISPPCASPQIQALPARSSKNQHEVRRVSGQEAREQKSFSLAGRIWTLQTQHSFSFAESTTNLGHPEHLLAYPAGACLLIKINGAFGNTDGYLRFYTETPPLFTHAFIFASSVIQYLYWGHYVSCGLKKQPETLYTHLEIKRQTSLLFLLHYVARQQTTTKP